MNKKKVGRPSRTYETKQKFFNLRKDLAEKLETYPNQTEIVEKALEINFNLESQSNTHLYLRKEALDRESKSIESILAERQRKEQQERQKLEYEQKKWQKEYEHFCLRLKNDTEIITRGQPYTPDICRIRDTFHIQITEKLYREIVNDFVNGKFFIEDFKKLRLSWFDELKLKDGGSINGFS